MCTKVMTICVYPVYLQTQFVPELEVFTTTIVRRSEPMSLDTLTETCVVPKGSWSVVMALPLSLTLDIKLSEPFILHWYFSSSPRELIEKWTKPSISV